MIRRPDEWLAFVRTHVDDGVPMTHIAAKFYKKFLSQIGLLAEYYHKSSYSQK